MMVDHDGCWMVDDGYGGDDDDRFYGGAPVGILDGGSGNDYFEGAFVGGSQLWYYNDTALTTELRGGDGDDIFNLQENNFDLRIGLVHYDHKYSRYHNPNLS